MRDSLRGKIRRLIRAINQALSESDGVSDSIDGVRDEGFDILLILEATVVLNKDGEMLPLEEADWEDGETRLSVEELLEEVEARTCDSAADLSSEVSEEDHEFLRSLRIRYS